MGTRSAPFVFLLLTACMTVDGAPTATRSGSAPERNPATAPPVALPAIPRMRPNVARKTETARAPVQTDAAKDAGHRRDAGATGAAPLANPADHGDGSGPADDATDAARTEPSPEPDGHLSGASGLPSADAGLALSPERDALLETTETSGGAGSPRDSADAPLVAGGIDRDNGETDAASDTGIDLAALAAPEEQRGIDVESLFDGDVVRYCAAMWQMGEYIGAARRRGEPFKQAIGDAVRRIADEKQLPLDNRLAFSGQVYGRLVYRLKDSHAARTLGTYVHFACLTVRGDKKIVPADPDAERLLNSGLALCESTAFTRDDLNSCIFRELTPIVDRRNG